MDKSIDPEELMQKLLIIYSGGTFFSNEIIVDILTSREIEILEFVRNGLTIDEICEKVFVSKRTISNHLSNIFSKLGVTNRQEAIYIAEQLGYFSPG
ncbi:TPA: response regulator transcription factor [Streptococcus agalactiae]